MSTDSYLMSYVWGHQSFSDQQTHNLLPIQNVKIHS
jgi:hypothetical protein